MIVALETSAPVGGVALVEEGRVLAERVLGVECQPARDLLPALDGLLVRVGRSLDEVDRIALSVGPGSFTGLRIGLATALGLCFATPRRIVPVPTLGALALGRAPSGPIVPMLDARKRQVYAGVYDPDGVALEPDCAMDPRAFLSKIRGLASPLTILGSGAQLYRSEVERLLGPSARILDLESEGWPSAGRVGLLGERLEREGSSLEPSRVELRYLRASQAETEGPAAAPA